MLRSVQMSTCPHSRKSSWAAKRGPSAAPQPCAAQFCFCNSLQRHQLISGAAAVFRAKHYVTDSCGERPAQRKSTGGKQIGGPGNEKATGPHLHVLLIGEESDNLQEFFLKLLPQLFEHQHTAPASTDEVLLRQLSDDSREQTAVERCSYGRARQRQAQAGRSSRPHPAKFTSSGLDKHLIAGLRVNSTSCYGAHHFGRPFHTSICCCVLG